MGNAAPMEMSRSVYINVHDKIERIVFSRNCSSSDVQELICHIAGADKYSTITLTSKDGANVILSPAMPANTAETAYAVTVEQGENQTKKSAVNDAFQDNEHFGVALEKMADQFKSVLTFEQIKVDLDRRLKQLEKRVEEDQSKLVEIEKCSKQVQDMRQQLQETRRKLKLVRENSYSLPSVSQPKSDVLAYPKYTLTPETVAYLKQCNFSVWHWENNEMVVLLEHMFYEINIVQEFKMAPVTLKRWLLAIQANYRLNPFHNFRHCFCVTQMMYGLIHLCQLSTKMTREDLGILLVSCICHDLDHPGYNNTYQINARTELALRYNDISPLENHHLAIAFKILHNPETNIFANVDRDCFKRIRAGMIRLILATDMARHAEILEDFRRRVEGFDFSKEDNLHSLKMVLIKCCDISNEVRPLEISEPWLDCLLEEYFNQADMEKKMGLPVAPFMDREKVTKPTAQIGFIKFVLMPMFQAVASLFPQVDAVMVSQLRSALERYEQLKAEDDEKKKQQPTQSQAQAPTQTQTQTQPQTQQQPKAS